MGYKHVAFKALSWASILRFSTRGIALAQLAILARLLTPLQFGYFGIASLLLAFLEILTETGINIFLIQEKGDIRKYLNSAWFVSILRGIILAICILIAAPFIASFFSAPEAIDIIFAIAIVPFIRGFINPAIILYQKELTFDKEFRLRFVLYTVNAIVSIGAAYLTRSAMSFVYGLIASALIEVILSFILFSEKPRFVYEKKRVFKVLRKGWWVTLTGIFSYFAENGNNIVVGRILGTSALGVFQIAYKFSTLTISEITNVVNQVVFPVYVKFADDTKRLLRAFLKVSAFSTLAALLSGGIIFFYADPIVRLTVGDQWLAAIPVMYILSIYGILRTIFGNFAPLFLAVGRQDVVAKMTFFRVTGLLLSIIPLVHTFGIEGAAYSAVFSILLEIPFILYFAVKVFRK